VNPLTHPAEWFVELREAYTELQQRRKRVAGIYQGFASELSHYCDGETARPRFRPKDLATPKQVPPLTALFDGASDIKPPQQRQLVSIVHHEEWLEWVREAAMLDAKEVDSTRRRREATRTIEVSQPMAGAWLRMLPTCPTKRIRTDEYRWELQRRSGLYVTGPPAEVAKLARRRGVPIDYLGDHFTSKGDRKVPHDDSMRVWHDMAQASATTAVVMGDKSKPEEYAMYNRGHTLDLGEPRQGKGGCDRVIELKAYNGLVAADASPPPGCTLRGDTHAFGNTEESLIRANKGVRARGGAGRWSSASGTGRVEAHQGAYHDAIYVKRNEFWLVIMNVFGGLNAEGVRLFKLYKDRAKRLDRTEYVASDSAARKFAPHWAQLLSAAIVTGDARRSLRAVDKVRDDCVRADAGRVLADLSPAAGPPGPCGV